MHPTLIPSIDEERQDYWHDIAAPGALDVNYIRRNNPFRQGRRTTSSGVKRFSRAPSGPSKRHRSGRSRHTDAPAQSDADRAASSATSRSRTAGRHPHRMSPVPEHDRDVSPSTRTAPTFIDDDTHEIPVRSDPGDLPSAAVHDTPIQPDVSPSTRTAPTFVDDAAHEIPVRSDWGDLPAGALHDTPVQRDEPPISLEDRLFDRLVQRLIPELRRVIREEIRDLLSHMVLMCYIIFMMRNFIYIYVYILLITHLLFLLGPTTDDDTWAATITGS